MRHYYVQAYLDARQYSRPSQSTYNVWNCSTKSDEDSRHSVPRLWPECYVPYTMYVPIFSYKMVLIRVLVDRSHTINPFELSCRLPLMFTLISYAACNLKWMRLLVGRPRGISKMPALRAQTKYVWPALQYHSLGLILSRILQLTTDPVLVPDRMHAMDGNSSVKRMTGSGHADERVFTSPLFISQQDVDNFKDDVKNKPGKETAGRHKRKKPDYTEHPTACADRWGASVASSAADETVQTFEQTGIFLCACRHGIVESVTEMRHSGEL